MSVAGDVAERVRVSVLGRLEHDAELRRVLRQAASDELEQLHGALLDAAGHVMAELIGRRPPLP